MKSPPMEAARTITTVMTVVLVLVLLDALEESTDAEDDVVAAASVEVLVTVVCLAAGTLVLSVTDGVAVGD